MTGDSRSFGYLLRHYRLASGLTQDELAERAGMSPVGIGALERGVRRRPQRATIDCLAQALNLDAAAVLALTEAARRGPEQHEAPFDPPSGHFLGTRPETTLIARDEQMARLRTILDSVETRHARFVLLAGEDGSGKTRLLQELMTQAVARGFTAVGVTCAERRRPIAPCASPVGPRRPRSGRRNRGPAGGRRRGTNDPRTH